MQPIQVAHGSAGLTYFVSSSPSALPPVLLRDLLAAWESARQAAMDGPARPTPRAFSFARTDGGTTELALSDPDAQCWAQAVDRRLDLSSVYGLSVCLRLLALVDLLARRPWAQARVRLRRGGAELDPALLRLAARAKLTDEAGFDEEALRHGLRPPTVQTDHA
jgi:hypothetical protein